MTQENGRSPSNGACEEDSVSETVISPLTVDWNAEKGTDKGRDDGYSR